MGARVVVAGFDQLDQQAVDGDLVGYEVGGLRVLRAADADDG